MEESHLRLANDIYVSQVLILAKTIKAEKAAKGVSSTSDFIDEALRLISDTRERILRTLAASR